VRTSEDRLFTLELTLGRVLQARVILSAVSLGAGLIAWLAGARTGFASLALTFGLLVLMATPILRVLVSLIAYVRMRDWFFVATTVMVFVLLAITVGLALAK
jgi:uncharacterized membrane protein